MPISLQADSLLPQGHISIDNQRVASFSTTGGLSASLANNIVTTNALMSGSVTFDKISQTSGAFSLRNKIINGNFNIWQRGTTFNSIASNAVTSDRWVCNYNNGGTRNFTRQSFTRGQTEVPNNPGFFLRFNQTVAGSSGAGIFNSITQRIESVATLASKQVVVTFWAKANTPITIGVGTTQFFGTGGSPSPSVNINFGNFSITTTWQKFTGYLTLPSIAGTQLGTDDNDFLQLSFNCPTNLVFQFDLAQVQLEEGSFSTPFEEIPPGLELSLCQRYYVTIPTFIISGTAPGVDQITWETGLWPVQMRKDPNVVRGVTVTGGTASNADTPAYNDSSRTHFTVRAQSIAAGNWWHYVSIIGDAEL